MANDLLRDGFVRICFDLTNNVFGDQCSVVIEGQFYDDGGGNAATPDTLMKVTSDGDLDSNFGAGSVLSEALKTALSCGGGGGVEFYALPRADAAGSTAAEYEVTVTGPATTDGRVDIYWGDSRWNISLRVNTGDTAADIATAIVAATDNTFPYTVTAAGGVVTLVAKNSGTVGNFLEVSYNWHGRNKYAPEGVTVTTAQTVVGAGNPAPTDHATVLGDCCVCALAVLTDDDAWQDSANTYLEAAWACDEPQCFGHGYTYNAGTLGQVLAGDTNSETLSRLAHGEGDPILPWLKVAAYAATSIALTLDNPEIAIQGPTFGVLECVRGPEDCSNTWTFAEQEQLRASGFVVTVPVTNGVGGLTSPQVTNDITNNRFDVEGRANATFTSVSSRRLASSTALAIAEQLQQFSGLGYFQNGTAIRSGTLGTNRNAILGTMRAWARSQVGVLFSEFENLNEDLTITDDFETAPRCQGRPGVLQMNFKYRPPLRVNQIGVNAAPTVLNNC